MVFVVPNYFLEYLPKNVIATKSLFCVAYSSKKSSKNIAVRNVTHAMILLIQGNKKLHLEEETISLNAGDILLLSQGNYFMSEIINKSGDYEAILIYFDDEFIVKFLKEFDINLKYDKKISTLKLKSDSILKDLINSYQPYKNTKTEQQNNIIILKTKEIFLQLIEKNPEKIYGFFSHVLEHSKDRLRYILEANIDLIDDIDDMAQLARVSKKELREKMQKLYNQNPKEWLNSKRLEKSSFLLKNSNKSISAIASSCGYASSSWFSSQYKSHFGCTPKEYRAQNQHK